MGKTFEKYDNLSKINCSGDGEARQFSLSIFEGVILLFLLETFNHI